MFIAEAVCHLTLEPKRRLATYPVMPRTRTIDISPPRSRAHQTHNDFTRRAAMERLDWIANLMDSAIVIPGTRISVGLDALIGLAPGIGDTVTTLISLWMVKEAHALGAPKHIILRMVGNVALDGVVGAVPLLGDAFDVMFRANRRNMKLLREHFEKEGF
jgi:uncharacterized protein DUF4112